MLSSPFARWKKLCGPEETVQSSKMSEPIMDFYGSGHMRSYQGRIYHIKTSFYEHMENKSIIGNQSIFI